MKVVCISGKAQHGKDTTAGYLKEFLEASGKKVLITHYGDLVKYVCKTFFGWDGQKNEAGRTILQRVGTDVIRAQQPDYWVSFVAGILKLFPDEWDFVLIPDCRFPNEVEYMEDCDYDVTHIRIQRDDPFWTSPLTEEQQAHISETALDYHPHDWLVPNDGDLIALKNKIEILAKHLAED